MGTDRKVPSMLDRLRPDIAVVPESSRHPRIAEGSLLSSGIAHAWVGAYDAKGLGIFSPTANRMGVHVQPEGSDPTSYALGVDVELPDRDVRVLGVWTKPSRTGAWATPYMDAFASILEEHEDFIDGPRSWPATSTARRSRHRRPSPGCSIRSGRGTGSDPRTTRTPTRSPARSRR